jgi:hypothetical protein
MGKKGKKRDKRLDKLEAKLNRLLAKEQGFYDGRFKEKVVPDKKKKLKKKRFSKKDIDRDIAM